MEIIDSIKTSISRENLKSYFNNNGYFNSNVITSININQTNNKYAELVYEINLGNQYLLDSIKTNIKSKDLILYIIQIKKNLFLITMILLIL